MLVKLQRFYFSLIIFSQICLIFSWLQNPIDDSIGIGLWEEDKLGKVLNYVFTLVYTVVFSLCGGFNALSVLKMKKCFKFHANEIYGK